jgi:RND superfamily putative drug exporter
MFAKIAQLVLHRRLRWIPLGFWPLVVVAAVLLPFSLRRQTTNDQASFMQADASSATAERLLKHHFPDAGGARAAVVIHRPEGLRDEDLDWLGRTMDRLASEAAGDGSVALRVDRTARYVPRAPGLFADVAALRRWAAQAVPSAFLTSPDRKVATASLNAGDFFLSKATSRNVRRIRQAVAVERPAGLHVHVTGSAGIGHDYAVAIERGLAGTHLWAILAVLVVLIGVYRSPVAIFVPLITIGISVLVTLKLAALMAMAGIKAPSIVEAAVVVIVYGSGTDYCLFLIARFREEMAADPSSVTAAARRAATATGPAIAASATTTAAGVALMGLSRMPTLSSCGLAMSVGLLVAMAVTLTFTPVLVSLLGRAMFWPLPVARLRMGREGVGLWWRLGRAVTRHPGRLLIGSLVVLGGLGAVVLFMPITYDTPSALSAGDESMVGMRLIERHFRPGELSPVQVVVSVPAETSASRPRAAAGRTLDEWAAALADRLLEDERAVSDVRGPCEPFGRTLPILSKWRNNEWADGGGSPLQLIPYGIATEAARAGYVAAGGAVVRFEVVLRQRPFSLGALGAMEQIRRKVHEAVRALDPNARAAFAGATATIADVRNTIAVDLPIIGGLVLLAVGGIVFITLRDFWMSVVMILATVLTVAATLGVIYLVFHHLLGTVGVDWKVAFILFVLLVAMGVDYNLYLATRIREQRRRQPLRPAVAGAVRRSGAVITSCGIVVAGTFAALAATPLMLMIQWGAAMALGILLDTLIVHPLVIPAFCTRFDRLRPRAAPEEPAAS